MNLLRKWKWNVKRTMMDTVAPAVVWHCPHWLVYWCMIRAWANATTGPYSDQEATAVTADKILTRWDRREGGDPTFADTATTRAAYAEVLDRTAREIMTHDDIEARYGIRPGMLCSECGVPIVADEITQPIGAAQLGSDGAAYHGDHVPEDHVPEDSAQIELDRARREQGW